jgi:hypothetical protein
MRQYTLVVDNGIPYEISCDDNTIKAELTKLKARALKGDNPYFDVFVYFKDKDITESQYIQEMIE